MRMYLAWTFFNTAKKDKITYFAQTFVELEKMGSGY